MFYLFCLFDAFVLFYLISFGGVLRSIISNNNDHVPTYLKIIAIVSSFLKFLETPFQLFIMWIFQCRISLISGYIQILALLNFSLWVFITFTITMTINDSVLNSIFGVFVWQTLVTVLGPLNVFYRFHVCIVLIKIESGKYSE